MTNDREQELLNRIAKLEAKVNGDQAANAPPPRRFDPTEGMAMPRAAMAEMAAVGAEVLPDIVRDGRRASPQQPHSIVAAPAGRPGGSGQSPRGNGWYQSQSTEDWAAARYGGQWAKPKGG